MFLIKENIMCAQMLLLTSTVLYLAYCAFDMMTSNSDYSQLNASSAGGT